jgi:hypothetical protein
VNSGGLASWRWTQSDTSDIGLQLNADAKEVKPYGVTGELNLGASGAKFKNGYFSGTVNSTRMLADNLIQDGAPVVDSLQIIRAFMKLRDAVDDPDSTVEQLRDKLKVAVVDIIDQFQELVDAVEPEVSTMPAPEDS